MITDKIRNRIQLEYIDYTARSREDDWNSKWLSECETKSSMVITGLFLNGSFEKRHEQVDHGGFRSAFRRAFRVSSSPERAIDYSIAFAVWNQTREPFAFFLSFACLFSHFLFLRAPNLCWPGSLLNGYYNWWLNQTPTHNPLGGAHPTPSAQCGLICTRTPSQPRRLLPTALITPVAWSGERPFLLSKNLQEETSLWESISA